MCHRIWFSNHLRPARLHFVKKMSKMLHPTGHTKFKTKQLVCKLPYRNKYSDIIFCAGSAAPATGFWQPRTTPASRSTLPRWAIFIFYSILSIRDPGSENLSILTQKIVSKLSEIWSKMFIPAPDLDFLPIPGPGDKKAPDPDPHHWYFGHPLRYCFVLQKKRA